MRLNPKSPPWRFAYAGMVSTCPGWISSGSGPISFLLASYRGRHGVGARLPAGAFWGFGPTGL